AKIQGRQRRQQEQRRGPPIGAGEGRDGRRRMTEAGGALVANLMHFGRTLRAAGLPVGPGKVVAAVEAVRCVGITDRRDFYWTLHAGFGKRPEQRLILREAFLILLRNTAVLERMS